MTAPASYAITADDVVAMTSETTRHALIKRMRQAVDKHYSAIMSELDRFDELSPVDRVRHAIVFSIISPKCPIDKNTRVTPVMVDLIMHGATEDQIRNLLLAFGIGMQNQKASRLYANSDFLRNCTSADMTRETLVKLQGISLKTGSMAMALYDQHADVFTLDTHMYRGLRELAGLPRAEGTHAAADGRYKVIEQFYLDVAREHCADAPIFLVQWALWNEFGFGGTHQVHLAIFGIKE